MLEGQGVSCELRGMMWRMGRGMMLGVVDVQVFRTMMTVRYGFWHGICIVREG